MGAGSEKTEKPTPKRVQEARERGQVAKSADFNGAMVLGTSVLLGNFAGPYLFSTVYGIMYHTFKDLHPYNMGQDGFVTILNSTIQSVVWLLIPFLIGLMVIGVLSNLVQVRPLFTLSPLKPNFSKLNPLQGTKRLFSLRSVVEIVKAIIKMAIIGVAVTIIIKNHQQELLSMVHMELPVAATLILKVLGEVATWSFILFFIIGLADWRYQAYELEKQLRMSRQEIKDERKNMEGDPALKGKIRQVGMQMVRKRQLANVPMADVIINNPTHISIAIKYDPDIAPAPRVIAKGQEFFALKIREVAKEHGIPMIENKPLARTLFKSVEVDQMIPPELFVAVAEVLAYVFSKNKGRRPKAKPVAVTSEESFE